MFRGGGATYSAIHRWDLFAQDLASSHKSWQNPENAVRPKAVSRDGRWLVIGTSEGKARLWDLDVGDPSSAPLILGSRDDSVQHAAIHPRGRWVATAGKDHGTVRLWNLDVAERALSPFVLRGQHDDGEFSRTAISSDDRWLITGSVDNTVRLWDLTARDIESSSKVLGRPSTEELSPGRVALDPTGRWLATSSTDSNVLVRDLTDLAASPVVLSGHERPARMAMSPDGRWLVTNPNLEASRVWELSADDPQDASFTLDYTRFSHHLAIAGNGRWFALPDEGDTYHFDLEAQDPTASPRVFRLPRTHFSRELGWNTDQIWKVAISPNARWLFTQRYNSIGQLWDLQIEDPPPHDLPREAAAHSVAMSPDGRWMVTGTRTGIAQLWDLTAPDPTSTARTLRGHEATIWQVRISTDSGWLVTDASDGTIRRWNLDVEGLLDYARKIAGRELTPDERVYYRLDR